MFATISKVKEITGYDVTQELIIQAQHVIQAYVGRTEPYIHDPTDIFLLEKATSFQAAYMKENPAKVYEQAAVLQTAQFGQTITLKNDGVTPWVAPMAVLACQRLSWKRARSVKVGGMFDSPPYEDGWRYQ